MRAVQVATGLGMGIGMASAEAFNTTPILELITGVFAIITAVLNGVVTLLPLLLQVSIYFAIIVLVEELLVGAGGLMKRFGMKPILAKKY